MTQDMKKNMILHKIGQLIVPLKRTVSPLEADSHSAPGGHFFNRSLLLLLLMLTLGVTGVKAEDDYSGTYYIANNDKSKYIGYDNAANFYLCPAQEFFVEDGLTTTSEPNGKPFLTTFQTTQAENALWIVEAITVNNNKYYTFKQKDGENYKYLTVNNALTGYGKKHRKRVHLEVLTPTTLTDKNYFNIDPVTTTASGIKGYSISYYKTPTGTTNKYLNPAGGNQTSYFPTELNETPKTSGGMVGFFTQGTTSGDGMGSVWFFEVPKPVIHIDENNKLTFSCVNEDVTFHYTINGEDPSATDSNIYDEDAENVLEDGHHTIKVMAVMNSGNTGYASGIVTQEVTIISTSISYLIQSKESPFYYLIPNLKVGDTDYPKNLTTLNVPCSTMVWNFEDAADNDGRYYYIHNSQGGYLYYTTSDNSNNYVYFNSTKDTDDDGYKFSITPHASGGFNIIPKGQTTPINKPSIAANNDGDRLSPVKLTGAVGDITSRWTLIPYTGTASLPQWTDVPFMESTDDVTHYYKIVSNIQTTKPLILDNSGDVKSETVPTTSYDVRKAMWVIKKVDSDTDGLLDYYTFKNAYTGELLYYNGKGRGIKDSAPVLQMGMPSTEGADATWSHFVVVQTVSGYNIIPRAIVDNTKSISRVGTGDYTDGKGFNCINRASGNDSPGTWYDNDGGSRWTFEEQTGVTCMEPVFTEEVNGDITITTVTNAAKILYTINDVNNPDASSTEYTAKENTSVQKVIKAIAIIGDDASTASEVVTLLNKPDVTLLEGDNPVTGETYTYDGTAKVPEVTVSIGSGATITTAPTATYTIEYRDNTNAGTATVTVTDAENNLWYIWNASTTFNITKAPLTAIADDIAAEYGDAPPTYTVSYDGFVNGETAKIEGVITTPPTLSCDYTQTSGRGTYTITPSGGEAANYEITAYTTGTLTVGPKTVGLNWSNTSLVYNGQSQAPSATATGLVGDDDCSVTNITGGEINVGDNYTATATALSNSNYRLPDPATTLFEITKRPVTISGIKGEDKVYDGTTDVTFDYSEVLFDNKLGNDDLTVTATGEFIDANAGTDKTVNINSLTLGDESNNYQLAGEGQQSTTTATITVKSVSPTIEVSGSFTYDGTAHTPEVTVKDVETVIPVSEYEVGYSNNIDAGTNTAIVTITDKENGNYNVSGTANFTISPKSIGIDVMDSNFTLSFGTGNSIILTDNEIDSETPLVKDVDYTYDDVEHAEISESHRYSSRTVRGINNYTGSFGVRNAIVDFTSDNGAEWSATFVAEKAGNEDVSIGHILPTGVKAYIITRIEGNWAIPEKVDYIPEGVPVLLLANEEKHGFEVEALYSGSEGITEVSDTQKGSNMLEEVTEDTPGYVTDSESPNYKKALFDTKKIYLLYNNEFVYNKEGYLAKYKVYLNPKHSTPAPAPDPGGARLRVAWNHDTGIHNLQNDGMTGMHDDVWYTLDGRRLGSKPSQKGLYLQSGKKIVVK